MDHYQKLKPWTDLRICTCKTIKHLLLVYIFSNNPIHCYECKNEVAPERLRLSAEQINTIANWQRVSAALNHLWLDSGEYEAWATKKLLAKNGQVNVQGLAIAAELSQQWPTYYWWFHDHDALPPTKCPNCNQPLDKTTRHGYGKCTKCHLVV